jgi:pyruvate/2-oxoacid:ferredoxin oxidoreductase alpha subunit
MIDRLRAELGVRVGVVVLRVLTPFPSEALAEELAGVDAVGVVNEAHHHGRGHLTLDVVDALARTGVVPPVESFFCGLGGADVSERTWLAIARATAEAAGRGRASGAWRAIHDGVELEHGGM